MSRSLGVAGLLILSLTAAADAEQWRLGTPTQIAALGTKPDLWSGTIAYLDVDGGSVYFYDGAQSTLVYAPNLHAYEPANANGSVAWRNSQDTPESNEIYRWDGQTVANVSNTPGVIESDLSAGSNGDLIWSKSHTWLTYFDLSTGEVSSLSIRGEFPSLFIAPGDVTTFAYQDKLTREVKYRDGSTTQTCGLGANSGAYPSLYDGAVAWVGTGAGADFQNGEIFYWYDGQMIRVTDDDAVNGVSDSFPNVWNGMVVWARITAAPFTTDLFLWDGQDTVRLTTTGGSYPSFNDGQIAWKSPTGLYLADLLLLGDMDCNWTVDLDDVEPFVQALLAPAAYNAAYPDCNIDRADVNGDGAIDGRDIQAFVNELL